MTEPTNSRQAGNVIYQKVQQEKVSDTVFSRVSSIFKLVPEYMSSSDYFLNPDDVSLVEYDPLAVAEQLG